MEYMGKTGHPFTDALSRFMDRWWPLFLILFGLLFIVGAPMQ